ncbi:MAG: glycerol-3-phosphate dehydrogenase [Hyphomicrobiaceae bacterium]|nr:glycerol-3-phosphate dehydrogenase [Hyphomicrobiaceae bacterium]
MAIDSRNQLAGTEAHYDVVVIGGGINGCGIAADAAGRGLSVMLAERSDLASGTSSASSKLIHGGLRYLEQYAFRLVAHSLAEREVLLANAPHIVWPLQFVVPHVPGMRSRLLMRAGLFLYDHLSRRQRLPRSGSIDLTRHAAARPLARSLEHGFEYWDCWVDDARLVVLVARLAAEKGARIATRTAVAKARREGKRWHIALRHGDGRAETITAGALVNAAGPWAGRVAREVIEAPDAAPPVSVRLVKGSHIVVPRIAGADCAYLCQAPDRRVVFVLPFADAFTLIGTTDIPIGDNPDDATVSAAEIDYLLGVINPFLATSLSAGDIVWRFAGVRPLASDGEVEGNPATASRDYRLTIATTPQGAPLLTVVGGKVTTYRRLAQSALELLAPHLGRSIGPPWTAQAPLPGGDMPGADFATFARAARERHPGFEAGVLETLLRRYGTEADAIIGDARRLEDMGTYLGGGLTGREVNHLVRKEWATTPEDILWRRTKAGLRIPPADMAAAEHKVAEAITAARMTVADN